MCPGTVCTGVNGANNTNRINNNDGQMTFHYRVGSLASYSIFAKRYYLTASKANNAFGSTT